MATNQYRLIYDSETPYDREDYGRFDFGDLEYDLAYDSEDSEYKKVRNALYIDMQNKERNAGYLNNPQVNI